MEWRLTTGYATSPEFFRNHPHVPGQHQIGYTERLNMVFKAIRDLHFVPVSLSDIGCGDGSLLEMIEDGTLLTAWGYDIGEENVAVAVSRGLDVRKADILKDPLEFGDITVCSEVLEHLDDPVALIKRLDGEVFIFSSPSAESPDWYYLDHAWAWDLDGYWNLIKKAGLTPIHQEECEAEGEVDYFGNGDYRKPRFQMVMAVKDV